MKLFAILITLSAMILFGTTVSWIVTYGHEEIANAVKSFRDKHRGMKAVRKRMKRKYNKK